MHVFLKLSVGVTQMVLIGEAGGTGRGGRGEGVLETADTLQQRQREARAVLEPEPPSTHAALPRSPASPGSSRPHGASRRLGTNHLSPVPELLPWPSPGEMPTPHTGIGCLSLYSHLRTSPALQSGRGSELSEAQGGEQPDFSLSPTLGPQRSTRETHTQGPGVWGRPRGHNCPGSTGCPYFHTALPGCPLIMRSPHSAFPLANS